MIRKPSRRSGSWPAVFRSDFPVFAAAGLMERRQESFSGSGKNLQQKTEIIPQV
jgi:hypothetical protein